MTIKITKGLDLSLEGEINHQVLPEVTNLTSRVAVLGKDFHGIRPTMFVSEGQQVTQGEKLFEDKKNPGYFHLSPVNGTISEINRGDRRSFLSMVIQKSNDDNTFEVDTTFDKTDDQVLNFLNNYGLLSLFKTRPFSKVPLVGSLPNKIFISLIDSNPLSFDPALVIGENLEAFKSGKLNVLVSCTALDEGFDMPEADGAMILSASSSKRQRIQRMGRVLRITANKENALIVTVYSSKTEYEKLREESNRYKLEGVPIKWQQMSL